MDNGLDIFNSTIAGSGTEVQRLLGLGVSTQLSNRNMFRGSEKYSISAAVSTQIDLSQANNRFGPLMSTSTMISNFLHLKIH